MALVTCSSTHSTIVKFTLWDWQELFTSAPSTICLNGSGCGVVTAPPPAPVLRACSESVPMCGKWGVKATRGCHSGQSRLSRGKKNGEGRVKAGGSTDLLFSWGKGVGSNLVRSKENSWVWGEILYLSPSSLPELRGLGFGNELWVQRATCCRLEHSQCPLLVCCRTPPAVWEGQTGWRREAHFHPITCFSFSFPDGDFFSQNRNFGYQTMGCVVQYS